jgi:hypothetical protein
MPLEDKDRDFAGSLILFCGILLKDNVSFMMPSIYNYVVDGWLENEPGGCVASLTPGAACTDILAI